MTTTLSSHDFINKIKSTQNIGSLKNEITNAIQKDPRITEVFTEALITASLSIAKEYANDKQVKKIVFDRTLELIELFHEEVSSDSPKKTSLKKLQNQFSIARDWAEMGAKFKVIVEGDNLSFKLTGRHQRRKTRTDEQTVSNPLSTQKIKISLINDYLLVALISCVAAGLFFCPYE